MKKIKITCIAENTSFNHSLFASHGQSLLLEIDDNKYLLDTTEIYEGLLYNMNNMNIKLEDIQDVILTHNHLDHSGGLFRLVDNFTKQRLFLPPDMHFIDETSYNIRYRTENKKDAIQKLLNYKKTIIVTDEIQIAENVFTTGPLEAAVKEQSVFLTIPNKGLVILIGCAHPTLPVIIEKAKEVTKVDKIYGIIGGLHYIFSNDKEIFENVKYIQSINPEFIVPSHCTGYKAIRAMQELLGEKTNVSCTGQFGTGNSLTILPKLTFALR